jgi:hypothetical protein
MLKVKSTDQLGDLTGERRPRAAAPAPAPVNAIPAVPQVDVDKLAQAVLVIAAQQRDMADAILRAVERPRQMIADIERNTEGRATRITIAVTG